MKQKQERFHRAGNCNKGFTRQAEAQRRREKIGMDDAFGGMNG